MFTHVAVAQKAASEATVVGQWTMRDTNSSVVEDSSGYEHDGVLSGASLFQSNPATRDSIEISGPTGVMSVAHTADFELARGAVETWINPKYMKDADLFNKMTFKTLRTGSVGAKSVFGVHLFQDGSLTGYILNDAEPQGRFWTMVPTPRQLVAAGKWHHIVLQWDGHHVALYVNGRHVSKRSYKEIPGAGLSYSGESTFTVGQGESPANTFIGRIGLTRIYRGTFTEEEIKQLADEKPVPTTGLNPSLLSIFPTPATTGTQVTMTGLDFGDIQGDKTVRLGGIIAQVNQWSTTHIIATVPYVQNPTGTATITQGTSSDSIAFQIVGPAIEHAPNPPASPEFGAPTIPGVRFGESQGSSTVTFNGVPSKICYNWTDTWVNCLIPTGATSGPIVVTVNGLSSNAVDYIVMPRVVISGVTPASAPVGTQITIKGSGFYPIARTIEFPGVPGLILADSWTDEEIKVTVPPGAITGNVFVRTWWRGNATVPFTVTSGVQP